jgi:hypothetical protein
VWEFTEEDVIIHDATVYLQTARRTNYISSHLAIADNVLQNDGDGFEENVREDKPDDGHFELVRLVCLQLVPQHFEQLLYDLRR